MLYEYSYFSLQSFELYVVVFVLWFTLASDQLPPVCSEKWGSEGTGLINQSATSPQFKASAQFPSSLDYKATYISFLEGFSSGEKIIKSAYRRICHILFITYNFIVFGELVCFCHFANNTATGYDSVSTTNALPQIKMRKIYHLEFDKILCNVDTKSM